MKTLASLLLIPAIVIIEPLSAQVLLISDQQGFRALGKELREEGYDVTLREEEYDNAYANLLDGVFLSGFDVVVYSETGFQNTGSVIPPNVAAALEAYVDAGGHLLVTGIDVIASPADSAMASLVGSTSTADATSSIGTWVVPDIDHPVINGPYGDFRGRTFAGIVYDSDAAEPNTGNGTVELAALGDPRSTGKILFTDRPGLAGSVTFWNGGTADSDADPQDELLSGSETGGIFRNYLACTDGLPVTPASRVVITEFMMAPEGSGNSIGQYIELFNAGPFAVDLDGWTIRKTSGSQSHTITGPVIVAPGAYALLGQTSDLGGTLESGTTADYDYNDYDFTFGGSGLQILDDQGVEIDFVNFVFNTFFPDASYNGVALVFTGDIDDDNAEVGAWAKAVVSEPGYAPGVVDLGSPRTAGSDQSAIVAAPLRYYVSFDLGDLGTPTGGEVIQTVAAGTSAVPPIFDVEPGWIFTGWNLDFSSVVGPMRVTALYEVETFALTFDVGLNGSRTGGGPLSQIVSATSPVVEPEITSDSGWRFVGWDTDFSTVTSDLTITAIYEAGPSAVAGSDITIIDETGDDLVLVRLDGSGSRPATGDFASWEWTWSGGSASGEVVDVQFPATDVPLTVTLTVTDGASDTDTDTLELTVLRTESGLFKDFTGFDTVSFGTFIDRALLAGDTLLVDGTNAANEKVYRLTAGSWVESPITSTGPDHALVDADTIVSGDFTNLSDFSVLRWNGGSWVSSVITVSGNLPTVDGFRKTLRFTADTVVIGDGNSDATASNAGQVIIYDWSGDTWTNSGELIPAGGLAAENRYGDFLAIEGDLIVLSRKFDLFGGSSYPRARLDLYRRSGATWSYDESLLFEPDVPTSVSGFALTEIDLESGVILARSTAPNAFVLVEEIASTWEQTEIPYDIAEYNFGLSGIGSHLDDDGAAMIAYSGSGKFDLFTRDASATDWTNFSGTGRRPSVDDLSLDRFTAATDFDSGRLAVIDGSSGRVRVFMQGSTGPEPYAIEATADAGPGIATTSFDGQPVRVFLNGGGSFHPGGAENLNAHWIWEGGSATGLHTFAYIDPGVTSIELVLTDGRGGVAKDTTSVSIIQPPVIDAGADVVVADVDADGIIRLRVSGSVISQDADIVSWTWRWTGGVLSGQSGTITLTEAARNQPVTLEVIDENGLSRITSFNFDLLDPDPDPDILTPSDGVSGDQFGAAVAIDQGVAMVGSPEKTTAGKVLGGSYLHENVTGNWQQIRLLPTEIRQGQSVEVSGEWAFVGAPPHFSNAGNSSGFVEVYRRVAGNWTYHDRLIPVDSATGFPRTLFNDLDKLFGTSMAIHGDMLIVGSPESAQNRGRAFLFQLLDNSWVQIADIDPPSGDVVGGFGSSVAIHGARVAISATSYQGNLNSGVAYVYEKGFTGWTFQARFESDNLTNPAITGTDFFGRAVAMNDTEILVGASNDNEDASTGAVYRYSLSGASWIRTGKLSEPANGFGSSLALLDDALTVAAWADITPGFEGRLGSVTTFQLRDGSWAKSGFVEMNRLVDPDIPSGLRLGYREATLDHDGRDLIVGGFDETNVMVGRAYIYRNFAGLKADVNFEPVADAGADINVNDTIIRGPAPDFEITEPLGSEEVILDGTNSSDNENGIVSYLWTWDGGSASGEMVAARFPVGTTEVTLTVTDDAGIVNSDVMRVTIALPQTPADTLPGTNNTLTVNLPVPEARWRLSSEFLWHGVGESAPDVVLGGTYQLEIIAYPGSMETVNTFVTIDSQNTVADLSLILPIRPMETGALRFPETAQGFAWRLTGESQWRDVADNGDAIANLIDFVLPVGDYRIEFKPVSGYATPPSRLVSVRENLVLGLDWGQYLRINNFDSAKTFEIASSADPAASPYQYVGMIRTPLGRGTGTVVAERVVLTAAHLFFDSTGLQWADAQWFPRQQQGARQAPPVTPRGILYRTSYAKLVAPDSVDGTVANLPDDDQEVDFAVLYFANDTTWDGGSANFLESSSARNWLTGIENKHAVGYPQRSQDYPQRGKMFEKLFSSALNPLDANSPPKLYETGEVFGDGGASGSALFVQPQGSSGFYPAAILLAGQGRAVYRAIDGDVTRMIKDGQDAASGNDDVLDNNSSLVTFGGLGGFTTLAVDIQTAEALPVARWSVTPDSGTGYSNLSPTQQVGFNESWANFTISFTAVSGYATPDPVTFSNDQVARSATNTLAVVYEPLSGYDFWKQDRGIASDENDRDHDGRSALVEYATDGDPDSGTDPVPIRVAETPLQTVSAEFEVYVSATADAVRYTVRASDTLPPENIDTLATFTKADGASGYLRVTDIQPKSASATRFAWVEYIHDRSLSAEP